MKKEKTMKIQKINSTLPDRKTQTTLWKKKQKKQKKKTKKHILPPVAVQVTVRTSLRQKTWL